MKILVTGAAGFIGSHLSERLVALGHEVFGIDMITDYYSVELKHLNIQDIIKRGVKFYKIDLVDDQMSDVCNNIEVVYHFAAQPGISDYVTLDTYIRNNVFATDRLLKSVKDSSSLKCVIYISTSSVYGKVATSTEDEPPKPVSYYAITKLAGEQLALSYYREYGLPVCSVRLYSVYGPRERPEKLFIKLIKSIFNDQAITIFDGSLNHSRSFTYVSDIVDGLASILDKMDSCNGNIFNLGSDQEFKTGDAIRIIEEIIGKNANKIFLPSRRGDQLKTKANIEKIKRTLSYSPRIGLREGLERTISWYKSNF